MDPRREAEDRPGETDPRTGSGDSRTGTLKKDRRSLVEIGTAAPPSRPDQGAFRVPAHSGAGKGAGEAGRARLRVATTFVASLSAGLGKGRNREPCGKTPARGDLPVVNPVSSAPLSGVADEGSIDRSPLPAIHGLRGIRPSWTSETGNPARWKQCGPAVRPGCLVSPDPYRGGGSHLHGRGLSAQRDPPFPGSGRPVTIEAEGLAAFPQPPPGRLREGRRPSPVTGPKP